MAIMVRLKIENETMINPKIIAIAALSMFVEWQYCLADIYSYTDAQGVQHFTNVPDDSRYKLIIKSRETKPGFRYPGSAKSTYNVSSRHTAYDGVVRQAAYLYKVDEALVRAVIHTESAYNPGALSHAGASGLMQLMPATASRYGVRDIFDPVENVHAGVRYLRDLHQMFGNDVRLALAAYNAGENAVLRYGGIPPFPETRHYVARVLELHGHYLTKM